MALIPAIIIFILGTVIGSFLNVIIYRCPHQISVFTPRSFCPQCRRPVKFYDNIPIISYLVLGGKCRFCKAKIPRRYLLVESITPVLYLVLYHQFQFSAEFLFYAVFISLLLVFSFIDLEFRIIPNKILLPGFMIGFLGLYYLQSGTLLNHIAGLAVIALSMLSLAWIGELIFHKESLGGGDIKLAALIGLILGLKASFFTLFLAFFLAALMSIILLKLNQSKLDSQIPFAPFLSGAVVINLFYGQEILQWYNNLMMNILK